MDNLKNKSVDELEERLLSVYRTGVEKGLQELKEGRSVFLGFYSGAMDIVWDYFITKKDDEISIEKKSIPQKTDYNIPGREVIAGHPMGSYKLTTERFYFDLGKNLERWKIAYNAIKRR